ncbi:hypothetical protein AD939_02825 [Gluconobacter oxydans]|uniref:Uncharacterized protein n=1 Tax=Gluconobacter oxydans TaxID=442 RepID=A0A149S9H9_GLUOY|nr:hypothetical protein AD934_00220 [Gluconobacter oxydans]KXV33945.1 hypothetical protein AD939_02825 [Gluconobacter oxydans]TCW20602.1 hypothetical protein EDC20_15211 [Gluconobacter oxydans]
MVIAPVPVRRVNGDGPLAGPCSELRTLEWRLIVPFLIRLAPAASFASAVAIQQNQFTLEPVNDNFCRVVLLTVLTGPLAGAEFAFEIDLATFTEEPICDVPQTLIENDDTVPFGALTAFAALAVIPSLRA